MKIHRVVVRIQTLDSQGTQEARDRVLRWIETHGHTAPGHGFEFLGVVGAEKQKESAE